MTDGSYGIGPTTVFSSEQLFASMKNFRHTANKTLTVINKIYFPTYSSQHLKALKAITISKEIMHNTALLPNPPTNFKNAQQVL